MTANKKGDGVRCHRQLSTMPSQLINIRFIRQNEKLAKNDDTMRIWSDDGQTFTVMFRSGETKKSVMTTMSDSAVFRWIRHTITLLEKDVDPFQFIQLDLPLMPSVLINAKDLYTSYNRILDAVEFHLDNWPMTSKLADPAGSAAPVNTGFASASDVETEDEEDYSDMPDLIPSEEYQHNYPTRQAVRTHHMFLD
jgi:hypothetical protein